MAVPPPSGWGRPARRHGADVPKKDPEQSRRELLEETERKHGESMAKVVERFVDGKIGPNEDLERVRRRRQQEGW